jgi:CRP/FNR family transcriptional regulator, cyclic AMP receptor protein
MQDVLVQGLGYLASVLVFCTFYMRTMLPLRYVAMASNLVFLAYAIPLRLWPIAILHALLLPLNVLRVLQIRWLLEQISAARNGTVDIRKLMASFVAERHSAGDVLFRKGDAAACAYYVARGVIDFPEIRQHAGAGELFGEVGLFSNEGLRTASAVCKTNVELYRVDGQALALAFHQSPDLAFALLRLVASRMTSTRIAATPGMRAS